VKKYLYLIISIFTVLRYSTNEAAKCCPNSLDIVFLSSHCKSVLLSPIRGMLSLFSVPFHLILYQMYFLSLLVPFIYFLFTLSSFSLRSYSFIILFLIVIPSFSKKYIPMPPYQVFLPYFLSPYFGLSYVWIFTLFVSVRYRYIACHHSRIILL